MTTSDATQRLLDRLEQETGVPDLARLLAERLSPSELTTLLLDVYRRHAEVRTPSVVLADFERDRFSRPSKVSPAALARFETLAFGCLPDAFDPVALSPVCPLGTSSVVAGVSQHWAVATSRGSEVVSDATNVLALEVASRRRALLRADPRSRQAVHLAAHHRLLRPQVFKGPNQTAHFALLALVSGARAGSGRSVEAQLVALHLRAHLRVIQAAAGAVVPLRVVLTDFSGRNGVPGLVEELLEPLGREFDTVVFEVAPERQGGRNYYAGLAFQVFGRAEDEEVFLVDGGEVAWLARLLSNDKERAVVSGLGSERFTSVFGAR
ncbi:hypothetical protein [Deinococcus pimensis]|uniref:hypothetical protein n=1 Tax=Deinococcus pimensis TaxID=309888 RepID=UPI000483C77B|nr:hypothetical protein [Deinococcus pimensis]